MSKSLEVTVAPKVLEWARKGVGMEDIDKVAKRVGATPDIVRNWELGEKKPTLIQLEKLAHIYKRPLAALFLSSPPQELPLPSDFRTLPDDKKMPLTSKTLLAIRRARRAQSLFVELSDSIGNKVITKIGLANLSDSPEDIADKIRRQLGISIQTQFNWQNERDAFDEWKERLENLGILVFQMTIPLKEVRGFSIVEGKIPVAVVSSSDTINGRIFSLFHEYGHILLNKSGICDMGDTDNLSGDSKKTEIFCNYFSGAFLVPKEALLNHRLVNSGKYYSDWPDEILNHLAREFKVSVQVILRRLTILRKADLNLYKRKHEEWSKKEYPKGSGGKRNPPKECIRNNGIPFVSVVLDAQHKEKITYKDMSDYLGIKLKHLSKIEQIIRDKG